MTIPEAIPSPGPGETAPARPGADEAPVSVDQFRNAVVHKLVYAVGKLMLLKLRRDFKEQQGAKYSQRAFHDQLLGNGTATFAVHRQLMLADSSADLLE